MTQEAMKLAFEALEKLWNIIDDIDTYGDMAKGDEKLYRALVERRQRTRFEETGISTDGYELTGGVITAIKAALAQPVQPEQEPVAWIEHHKGGDNLEWDYPGPKSSPLYTAPPQRPWVGLTAKQAAECWTTSATQTWKNFEAKLKEKNDVN